MKKSEANPTVIRIKDAYDYDAVCPHDFLHFKSAEEWRKHHLNSHVDTTWRCPLCGINSSSWYNYAYHVQTSTHKALCPPPWICKLRVEHQHLADGEMQCGARFGSKYQWMRHVRKSHANCKVSGYPVSVCDCTLILSLLTLFRALT